jgi:hexose-6-phosphate dehydrogenase
MGKGVVQAILPFRQGNKHWLEALWTGKHVASVEVSMKETEDCEGRTSFYEGYGVIRDVLQNHLTQVLVLLNMDLPTAAEGTSPSSSSVFGSHQHRTAVLEQLTLLGEMETPDGDETRASIHVGQYQGYHAHVASDRRSEPLFVKTTVPTAASVTLASKHPRWEGARFTLKAGKALDTRTSYAKVVLCGDGEGGREGGGGCGCVLFFNIQGGEMGTAIAWNRTACAGLIDPEAVQTPAGWVVEEGGGEGKDLHVLRPKDGESSLPNAYEFVVEAVLAGDRSMFLGTEELLHQWRVWDKVLTRADAMEPELYPKGFALEEVEVTGFIGVGAEGENREEL